MTTPQHALEIDGSTGEGGGQVLRSALALSIALGIPFRIRGIRAGRDRPGLLRQHLTAVQAACSICDARCDGAELGSGELRFAPGPLRPGSYRFAIGTAGSTALVLQAILPPLLFANAPSDLIVEGGTHARGAPSFEFLARTLAPTLGRLGCRIDATLVRHGFFPVGGGAVRVVVAPIAQPAHFSLHERGVIRERVVEVILSGLPFDVASRELAIVSARLGWPTDPRDVRPVRDAASHGNAVLLSVTSDALQETVSAFGEPRRSAESVACAAVDAMRAYLAGGAPVGEELADQLMVPLAIAATRGAGACGFTTTALTRHSSTNSAVVAAFLGREPIIHLQDNGLVRWTIA